MRVGFGVGRGKVGKAGKNLFRRRVMSPESRLPMYSNILGAHQGDDTVCVHGYNVQTRAIGRSQLRCMEAAMQGISRSLRFGPPFSLRLTSRALGGIQPCLA